MPIDWNFFFRHFYAMQSNTNDAVAICQLLCNYAYCKWQPDQQVHLKTCPCQSNANTCVQCTIFFFISAVFASLNKKKKHELYWVLGSRTTSVNNNHFCSQSYMKKITATKKNSMDAIFSSSTYQKCHANGSLITTKTD